MGMTDDPFRAEEMIIQDEGGGWKCWSSWSPPTKVLYPYQTCKGLQVHSNPILIQASDQQGSPPVTTA